MTTGPKVKYRDYLEEMRKRNEDKKKIEMMLQIDQIIQEKLEEVDERGIVQESLFMPPPQDYDSEDVYH
jgi:hypothetical protein